jgi:glycosyltransferase involved in cell wall biosynthesis
MLRMGERFAARFGDSVVCLNQQIAAEFSRNTGRTERVFIVLNGTTAPPGELSTAVLDRLAIESGSYVLAVARLVPEKNIHLLIEAFLTADLPSGAKLVVAGAADYHSRYSRALIDQSHTDKGIVMAGTVFGAELWALYRHAGLFVLSSLHEGMSFSLLEAGIAGVKIVASDIPANSLVCREFARLTGVESAIALAAAITSEWHRERSSEEVERQITLCRSRFDWSAISRAMEPILLQKDIHAQNSIHGGGTSRIAIR